MIPIIIALAICDEGLQPCILSIDDETCPDGYDITKDGLDCVRAEEVDCNEDPDSTL